MPYGGYDTGYEVWQGAPEWEVWALDGQLVTGQNTLNPTRLQRVGLFTQARNRQLVTVFNRPGTFSCTVPLDYPNLNDFKTDYPYLGAVELVKNGNTVWSGFLQAIEDDLIAETRKLTYMGWGEIFRKRWVQEDKTYGDDTGAINSTGYVQIVGATGGTFRVVLTLDNPTRTDTTTDLAYNVSAADFQTALEAFSFIAPGDVTVSSSAIVDASGRSGTKWLVTFNNSLSTVTGDLDFDLTHWSITVGPTGGGGSGSSIQHTPSTVVDIVTIAKDMLDLAKTNFETGFRDSGIPFSTGVQVIRTIHKGDNVGDVIQQMSDVEDGYDYKFYLQRTGTSAPYIEYQFGSFGTSKPDARFELGTNVASLTRAYDGQILANRIKVSGDQNVGYSTADDTVSQNLYGLQEDQISLSGVTSTDVLNAYAQIEKILRANGRVTWNLVPMPDDGSGSVPSPFVDYDLGDTVYLTAEKGPVSVFNQGIRIFGISIDLDDNGNEIVSSLQVSPP